MSSVQMFLYQNSQSNLTLELTLGLTFHLNKPAHHHQGSSSSCPKLMSDVRVQNGADTDQSEIRINSLLSSFLSHQQFCCSGTVSCSADLAC